MRGAKSLNSKPPEHQSRFRFCAWPINFTVPPQDIGYAIAVAVVDGWDKIGEAYPAAVAVDPVRDVISQIPELEGLYLHAGVVQYALENGIEVPKRLIPPEYVPVQ